MRRNPHTGRLMWVENLALAVTFVLAGRERAMRLANRWAEH